MGTTDTRTQAREYFEVGAWDSAFDTWSRAEFGVLSTTELEQFATTAELLGRFDETIRALQRAFSLCQEAGDLPHAVRFALRIALFASSHAEPALSSGWASRTESLVSSLDADAVERGWVAFLRMFRHLGSGDFAQAAAAAEEATASGRQHTDSDLIAMGVCAQGRLALYGGQIAAGLALIDEAMLFVIGDELSPIFAGQVFCTAIEGCQEIGDFARMEEWTVSLERWCTAQPALLAFTGQCAVHRGQLQRLHGDWAGALEEFSDASRRYRAEGSLNALGLVANERGDILRMQGLFDAADAEYQRASEHGFDPQPGLALLWLATGKPDAATAAAKRLLAEPNSPVHRCRILPAAIEILLAADDIDAARTAAKELHEHAARIGTAMLEATAAYAFGAIEFASGDASGALPYLRKALQLWALAGDVPDEARTRLLIGTALDTLGDAESSRRELETARDVFVTIGAVPAINEVDRQLGPASNPAGLTDRELEVMQLVGTGLSNAQIATDLFLSEKTIARHLSNIFVKLDVRSRTAVAAYAFEHGLM